MRKTVYTVVIPAVVVLLGLNYLVSASRDSTEALGAALPVPVESSTISLEEYIQEVMDVCGVTGLSPGRKQLLVRQIAHTTENYLRTRSHQEAFISLICIESKFRPDAKSTAGAVGIAQVVPKYASEFASSCGYSKLDAADLLDTEVNLSVGACRFGELLAIHGGNVALALSGYNSGAYSPTTKKLGQLVTGHPETMAYVAKFYTLQQQLVHIAQQ